MELNFTIHDAVTQGLRQLANNVQRRDLLEAAGMALMSLTRRAFQESQLRPAPWKERLPGQGSHALLKKSGTLWRSIRVSRLSADSVSVTSDRVYAAIHQMGGVIRPKTAAALKFQLGGKWVTTQKVTIPARPFFPVINGHFTPAAEARIGRVIELKLESFAAQL